MAATTVRGAQIRDATVQRVDVDVATVGQSLVRKLVQGNHMTLTSTGADAGTGDVTVDWDEQGTNTNDNATAGQIGERIGSFIAASAAVTYTTNQTKNLTSISLTAGDWDVRGQVTFLLSSVPASTLFGCQANIGTTTGAIVDDGGQANNTFTTSTVAGSGLATCSLSPRRISLASTTTVYLVGDAPAFASGSCTAYGFIEARRMR